MESQLTVRNSPGFLLCALLLSGLSQSECLMATANLTIYPSQELRVVVGDEVSFECVSENPDVTRVEWVFLNQTDFDLWPFTHPGGRVFLRKVPRNFSGIYECRAYSGLNPLGSAHFKLAVLRQPQADLFRTWNGHRVVHTCKVDSDAPITNVTWYWRDDPIDFDQFNDVFQTMNQSGDRYSLVIDSKKSWARGKFSCVVENDFGQNATNEIEFPGLPNAPQVEVVLSADGSRHLRFRIKKEYCGKHIDLAYWKKPPHDPDSFSLPAMISVPCRARNIFSSVKQLLTGFVDITVDPKREMKVEAEEIYYAQATPLDELGNAGPSEKFIFETSNPMDKEQNLIVQHSPESRSCLSHTVHIPLTVIAVLGSMKCYSI